MAIAVADVISKLGYLLNDVENIRWTNDEVYGWINDAAAAIIDLRPMAGSVTENVTLGGGALQNFDCVEIIDLVRNVGGQSISRTDRFLLDTIAPDWYQDDQAAAVIHYTFDERHRNQVYVYPPVINGTEVEATLIKLPATITAAGDNLDMNPDYINAVINYCMYRCYGKDDEVGNGALSGSYFGLFQQSLGVKNQVSIATSPNRADP